VKSFLHAYGVLGALIAAGPTVAADLPVREVAPVYAPDDWSGFYIGAHVEDFDGAFAMMPREHAGGCLVVAAPLFSSHRARLAELALKRRPAPIF
jgi:hypothetical protein